MKEEILEFGIKRENEERRDGGFCIVFEPNTKKYAHYKHPRSGISCFFGGGFDEDEDEKEGCLRELKEESGFFDFSHVEKLGNAFVHYFNSNKQVNRSAYTTCFLVILNSLKKGQQKLEAHEADFSLHFSTGTEILASQKSGNHNRDYEHWIYFLEKAEKRLKELKYL
jgi:ADP-ribose pyrophosphatase YjhB (NUDIX family)